jgi:hypothetical protein
MKLNLMIFITAVCLICNGCGNNNTASIDKEKTAIIKALNDETNYAYSRNYAGWQKQWVQESFVSKTYMRMQDSKLEEMVGWEAISSYMKDYIAKNPNPDPLPSLLNDINVRLYHEAAWVTYTVRDSVDGLKRESRLMEKKNKEWKIAGMHTTIYGVHKPK